MPPFIAYLVYGYVRNSKGDVVPNATLKVETSVGNAIYTTDSDGIFLYDLAEIGYTSGETVEVKVTEPYNNEFKDHSYVVEGVSNTENIILSLRTDGVNAVGYVTRPILHSVGNEPVTRDNPLAIEIIGQSDVIDLVNNPQHEWAVTRQDRQPDSETVTMSDGTIYKRTFTYINDVLTLRGKWIRQ